MAFDANGATSHRSGQNAPPASPPRIASRVAARVIGPGLIAVAVLGRRCPGPRSGPDRLPGHRRPGPAGRRRVRRGRGRVDRRRLDRAPALVLDLHVRRLPGLGAGRGDLVLLRAAGRSRDARSRRWPTSASCSSRSASSLGLWLFPTRSSGRARLALDASHHCRRPADRLVGHDLARGRARRPAAAAGWPSPSRSPTRSATSS